MASEWVEMQLAQIDEDKVYASIGAYDPEAFKAFISNERTRFEGIEKMCNTPEDQQYREFWVTRRKQDAERKKEREAAGYISYE